PFQGNGGKELAECLFAEREHNTGVLCNGSQDIGWPSRSSQTHASLGARFWCAEQYVGHLTAGQRRIEIDIDGLPWFRHEEKLDSAHNLAIWHCWHFGYALLAEYCRSHRRRYRIAQTKVKRAVHHSRWYSIGYRP